MSRGTVLRRVADLVPHRPDGVRMGIDGVDGSGKTVFADELAGALRAAGRAAVRVSVDDFHNVRAIRYRRGGSRSAASEPASLRPGAAALPRHVHARQRASIVIDNADLDAPRLLNG